MAPASVLLPFHTNLQRSPKMVNCGQPCLMKFIPQLSDRPLKLLLRIHHDRPIPCDRFLDRLARHQQEADALVAGLHHDLVAAVKEHQRVIAHVVDGRRVRFRDLLGQNRTGM